VDTATVDAAQLFELTAGSSALVVLFRCATSDLPRSTEAALAHP